MNKKMYLIIMRIVNAAMFFVAVIFMILDTLNPNVVFMYLYVVFFCSAAVLLIASSIIDLIRMEKFVKKMEKDDSENDSGINNL